MTRLLVHTLILCAVLPVHAEMVTCDGEIAMIFEGWRQWTRVIPKPVVSEAHGDNWVGIYVNELAKSTYLAASAPYPVCAQIIKPVYTDASGSEVRKLTVMVKMPSGYDPDNENWWYGKYDESGTHATKQGKLPGCIVCHKQAAETDYLFSKEVLGKSQD